MNRRGLAIGVLFAIPLAALVAWWLATFERVAIEIDLPMRGEARYNPLYALKKTLQAQAVDVAAGGNVALDVDALGSADLLVLTSDIRLLGDDQAGALLSWVEEGGHLVFALPPTEEGRDADLLDMLGLWVNENPGCLAWDQPIEGKLEPARANICFATRFHGEAETLAEFNWLWGSEEAGYLMGRSLYGDGSVFVASELDFLDNRQLDEPGMAALAWQVLAPALGEGKVHLVYAASIPPLYVTLVRDGWPVLLPLLLALLGWLWMRSQRFGPLQPLAAPHRRALLEHVQAAGEFAFHRGRSLALYAALQRMFHARLKRRDPALAALEGEALVQALCARSQIAASAIRQALNPVDLARPDQFLATTRTLMQLRAKT